MKIVKDTAKYQKLLLDKKTQSSPLLKRTDLDGLSEHVYVLTGDKTPDFGGGPSPFGFVMDKSKVVGRVRLEDAK